MRCWHAARLRAFGVAVAAVLLVLGFAAPAAAAPSAPAPVSPAASASVTMPFTIAWSPASDPSGILAYNWQVSATSTFAKVLRQDSVMAPRHAVRRQRPRGRHVLLARPGRQQRLRLGPVLDRPQRHRHGRRVPGPPRGRR